jgi:hypothetical protein
MFDSNSSVSDAYTFEQSDEKSDKFEKPFRRLAQLQRSHIVDDLDLLEFKKFTIAPFSNDRPLHLKQSHSTNFIKKNIEKSDYIAKKLAETNSEQTEQAERIQFSIENFTSGSSSALNVEDRFYKKAEKSKVKIEQLKGKLANEEVESCTFKPKTNIKENLKTIKMSEFIRKNDEIVQKKRKKLQEAIEKAKNDEKIKAEQDPNVTLRPKLCEKSKEILANKPYSSTPAFQRLYQLKNQTKKVEVKDDESEEIPEVVYFKPQINKKSQNIKRDQPTCLMLYQQANHKKSISETPKINPKLFSENSEKILINKFCKEFNEKIEIFEGNPINYSEFNKTLEELGFVEADNESEKQISLEFWNFFKKTEEILELDSLFTGLLIVQGLVTSDTPEIFISEDYQPVQKTFEHLYINRKTQELSKKSQKFAYKDSNCTFNPEIIPNSQTLAEKWRTAHRSAVKIEDMLAEEDKNKQEKIQKLKEQVLAEEVKECTFAPKTESMPDIYEKTENDYTKLMSSSKTFHKGNALHNYYSLHKVKKETTVKTMKEELNNKVLQECTFVPTIKSSDGGNIESFLERMKERNVKKDHKCEGEAYFKFDKSKRFKSFSVFDPPVQTKQVSRKGK